MMAIFGKQNPAPDCKPVLSSYAVAKLFGTTKYFIEQTVKRHRPDLYLKPSELIEWRELVEPYQRLL